MRASSPAFLAVSDHSSKAGCDARARTSASSTSSDEPVRSPRPNSRSTPASSSHALRASARECRRGSRGVSSATTSATAPPIAASIHRPSGPPLAVSAGSPTITSAWTPACVVSRTPRSMNRAIVAARNTTTATCHTPLPMRRTSTSPSATPIATPTASSATRRTERSAVNPSATHAQTGAKNGYGWCTT